MSKKEKGVPLFAPLSLKEAEEQLEYFSRTQDFYGMKMLAVRLILMIPPEPVKKEE